ncbi:MAG: flavodoxin family protein [Oscillospiraceae bacterium]|jgi:multimeric flavodoxin WrbA|nr:flavodoxin family protein [Oscillospiraceae bacterium]
MKIVVLSGSPRPNGNTAALVSAFKEGAESKGHTVSVLQVGTMKIGGCRGCEYCHDKGGGKCVQKDDMDRVYPALAEADMTVLASPVYYFGLTGQLQSAISRFYAVMAPAAKKWALILTSGSPDVYGAIETQYRGILNFIQAEDLGIFEYDGRQAGTEAASAEVRAFGASL